MTSQAKMKRALERSIKAVTLKPSIGIGVESMHCTTNETGLCQIVDGETELIIDVSEEYGGNGATPSPGFYVRASLAACLAQGYRVWAAYLDLPVERIDVSLHTEYDIRGNLGIDKRFPVRYTACRYTVEIESTAPEDKIMEMLDRVDEIDFVRDVFAKQVPMEREVLITRPASKRKRA